LHAKATETDALMLVTEVGEVWGVGRRIGAKLKEAGIHSRADLLGNLKRPEK